MMSSSQAHPFDVWLVYLHFMDHPETGKVRPVLVVATKKDVIAVAKITSKPPAPHAGDISITRWQEAGLNVPSTVRCSQLFEISPEELLRDKPLGILQPFDIEQIIQAMVELGFFQLSNSDQIEDQSDLYDLHNAMETNTDEFVDSGGVHTPQLCCVADGEAERAKADTPQSLLRGELHFSDVQKRNEGPR